MRFREFRIALTLNSILATMYEKNGQLLVKCGCSNSRLATNLRPILLGPASLCVRFKSTLEVSHGSTLALAAELGVPVVDNLRLVYSYG